MPIYSYACSACDAEVEQMRRIDERDSLVTHSDDCPGHLVRGVDIPGAVWAPTASKGGTLK